MKEIMELVLLIDRSRSLYGRERQVYEQYRKLLNGQTGKSRKCFLSVGLFSNRLEIYCLHSDSSYVREVPEQEFTAFGNTHLYDGVIRMFRCVEESVCLLSGELDVQKYIYIITDGFDTGSPEHGRTSFRDELIRKTREGWHIIFLDPSGEEIPLHDIAER